MTGVRVVVNKRDIRLCRVLNLFSVIFLFCYDNVSLVRRIKRE